MKIIKTCPICKARAVRGAHMCYECFYRFSDRSTRNVKFEKIQKEPLKVESAP